MQYLFWIIVGLPLLLAAYSATLPMVLPLIGLVRAWQGNPPDHSFSFLPGVATLIVLLVSPLLLIKKDLLASRIALVILILDVLFWFPLLLFIGWERYFRPRLKHGPE